MTDLRPRHGFDSMAKSWAQGFLAGSDRSLVPIVGAVATWVNIGRPETRGLQQCLNACFLIQMLLDTVDVDSVIVPARVEVSVPRGETLGVLGTTAPHWDAQGTWSGHCALWIPHLGLLLDATIGQCPGLDSWNVLAWQPLLSDCPTPMEGVQFRLEGHGYTADYSVLNSSSMPNSECQDIAQLAEEIAMLRETTGKDFKRVFGEF